MLSDFGENAQDSKHCEDRESEEAVMRENTGVAMLVRTMAKGVAGVPAMITMTSIGYGHV
jgi:hypothetical protein